jgi:hypothetical protein
MALGVFTRRKMEKVFLQFSSAGSLLPGLAEIIPSSFNEQGLRWLLATVEYCFLKRPCVCLA